MIPVIAEIGQNHEHSLERAKNLCSLAKDCCAYSVKFQLMTCDIQESQTMKKFNNDIKKGLMYSYEWIKLAKYCYNNNIDFFVTCFDEWSVDFAIKILGVNKIKIASCSNTDWKLLKKVASTKYDTIISTGFNRSHNDIIKMKDMLINPFFLHCISEYPCKEPFLSEILNLKSQTGCKVGFSDHTIGTIAAINADRIYDAEMLELHFTDDKNFSDFRDHKLSKTPEEFRTIINKIRS